MNAYAKLHISKLVAAKFQDSKTHITILKFIKNVVGYKDFSFKKNLNTQLLPTSHTTSLAAPAQTQTTPTARVKMPCMPEIPQFEETLGSIDKTQPLEARVKSVLVAMGSGRNSYRDSQLLLGIAVEAVQMKDINYDDIFNHLEIPEELQSSARMKFSAFINEFIEKYAPEEKMVKAMDFLKDLQQVVMSEEELSVLV